MANNGDFDFASALEVIGKWREAEVVEENANDSLFWAGADFGEIPPVSFGEIPETPISFQEIPDMGIPTEEVPTVPEFTGPEEPTGSAETDAEHFTEHGDFHAVIAPAEGEIPEPAFPAEELPEADFFPEPEAEVPDAGFSMEAPEPILVESASEETAEAELPFEFPIPEPIVREETLSALETAAPEPEAGGNDFADFPKFEPESEFVQPVQAPEQEQEPEPAFPEMSRMEFEEIPKTPEPSDLDFISDFPAFPSDAETRPENMDFTVISETRGTWTPPAEIDFGQKPEFSESFSEVPSGEVAPGFAESAKPADIQGKKTAAEYDDGYDARKFIRYAKFAVLPVVLVVFASGYFLGTSSSSASKPGTGNASVQATPTKVEVKIPQWVFGPETKLVFDNNGTDTVSDYASVQKILPTLKASSPDYVFKLKGIDGAPMSVVSVSIADMEKGIIPSNGSKR